MFRLRRLLLSIPVASLLFAGVAFGEEPAKMTPVADQPAAQGAPQGAAPITPAPAGCPMVIAGQPCNSCQMPCDCCPKAPHCGIFADYMLLKARNADIPYARPVDDLTLSLTSGPIAQVNQDYKTGYRFGIWGAVTPDVIIRATVTEWKGGQGDTTTAADNLLLQSLVTVPEAGNNSIGFLNAAAAESIKFRNGDLDAAFTIWGGGCDHAGRLAAVAGIRYGQLKQDFLAIFESAQSREVIVAQSHIEGYGPRLGLEGDVGLRGRCYFYGSGVWSLLVAHEGTSYNHADQFQGTLVSTGFSKDRIVPTFDLELGFGTTCCCDHLNIRVGYLISAWGNVVTTNGLVQGVQQNDFTTNRDNLRDNLTFDGFVARVEFRW
jgi:hypothetical protein